MNDMVRRNDILAQQLITEARNLPDGPSLKEAEAHMRRCVAETLREKGREQDARLAAQGSALQYERLLQEALTSPALSGLAMEKMGDFSSLPRCPDEAVILRHFKKALAAALDRLGESHRAESIQSYSFEELVPLLAELFEIFQFRFTLFNFLLLRNAT